MFSEVRNGHILICLVNYEQIGMGICTVLTAECKDALKHALETTNAADLIQGSS